MSTRRHARIILLIFALSLEALALLLIPSAPARAEFCGYRAHYTYYAEAEKITVVGTCDTYCGGRSSCTGTTSPYYVTNYKIQCTICP